ncbi:MAG: bifunctional UDP-N-acetylmuramoyl-tripeptide:D-alanyl-D-alanine ligase/alanine racemase [Saprospiraceae bacterium]|nr:bifunctional UDP-N-acetylmuramoyl-tripeptide:D-alanyl-D-alanine ligase/alanine racemase [Saprospiraceae bacterium]
MKYLIADIQKILGAKWVQQTDASAHVEFLLLDSRHIAAPAVSLFFALPGKRHDGHRYLVDLHKAGVRHFVVSEQIEPAALPEANILQVPDTLTALQAVAAHHRSRFHVPVVGITGSNGKTVVKEWLEQLLSPDYNIVRSPKSYNSQVGVPLSVWQMQPEHTLAIFEAGISQPGEMERLARIIRPTIGIFTNIGTAHREGFSSKSQKVWEKMRLFENVETLIYCCDYSEIEDAVRSELGALDKSSKKRVFCWSKEGKDADMQITGIEMMANGFTRITGAFVSSAHLATIEIPFTDAASIENAIHCWVLMYLLDIAQDEIVVRMFRLEPVEMRLELKTGINRCVLVNDFYNNDLNSLRIALQFAAQQARTGRFTVVLSDILQSGEPTDRLYAKVAAAMLEKNVTRLIGIGQEVAAIRDSLPPGFEAIFFQSTDVFLQKIQNVEFENELVLLKGARVYAFERIARRLEQKAHKTVLEVNLSALIYNLNIYSQLLRPGTKMLAMVKASGYGSGSAEVAKLLEFHKVDYLGVAYTDEGVELRQAGVRLPILVLNPDAASFDAIYRYGLEPEVYGLRLLDELARFAGKVKRLAIHLKLDTGMHRLGFEPKDVAEMVSILQQHENLEVRSVFSHLSASDAPQHDSFTHQQAARFAEMFEKIKSGLGYAPLRHLVNTGGIARFPAYHFDMVRLGIGLYGIDASGLQERLRVVNTLKATVSQIKEVPPGDTVGYNRNSGPLDRARRIATISIGYADGLLRLAGGGRYSVSLRGQLAPTIGNVCMDMTMVDVTHIPAAKEGDEVIVFGENPSVQALATCLQTIPYEVFTNISERVKRVYWQE